MNDENLIPITKRSKREQREIQAKGGRNSGKSRRKRKEFRETLEAILSQPIPQDNKELMAQLKRYGIDKGDYSQLLMATLVQKALKGDIKAFSMILDIMSEDALKQARIALLDAQKEKITHSDIDIEDLTDIESRIYEQDDTV